MWTMTTLLGVTLLLTLVLATLLMLIKFTVKGAELAKKAKVTKRAQSRVIDGDVITQTVRLSDGHTTEDAKKKRASNASVMGIPVNQLHVRDHSTGNANLAELVILRKNPFADVKKLAWPGPQYAGQTIAEPIGYATYEDA